MKAQPSCVVMRPEDWVEFDLLTDDERRYYFCGGPNAVTPELRDAAVRAGVAEAGATRLWGLPVMERPPDSPPAPAPPNRHERRRSQAIARRKGA